MDTVCMVPKPFGALWPLVSDSAHMGLEWPRGSELLVAPTQYALTEGLLPGDSSLLLWAVDM